MERASAAITIFSAALAGLFIYYSHPISQKFTDWMGHRPQRDQIVLATVEQANGSVSLRRLGDGDVQSQSVFSNEPLYHLDQITVAPSSNVTLEFLSGYRLKLSANTNAIIQSYAPQQRTAPVLVTMTNGNYQLISRGHSGQLFIALNNQIFAPEFRPTPSNQLQLNQGNVWPQMEQSHVMASLASGDAGGSAPDSEPRDEPDTVTINGHETLSNTYIARTFEEQAATGLRHCQLNSLRDNLTADGSLLFSITIAPTGQIHHLAVLRNAIDNQELIDCTQSVIERLRFRPYRGQPITISYPIEYR